MKKQIDESKLVKKYYVEYSVFPPRLGFAIVHGTVGKLKFIKKDQETLVGSVWDTAINIDSSYLFDDFNLAKSKFLEVSNTLIERKTKEIKEIQHYADYMSTQE